MADPEIESDRRQFLAMLGSAASISVLKCLLDGEKRSFEPSYGVTDGTTGRYVINDSYRTTFEPGNYSYEMNESNGTDSTGI